MPSTSLARSARALFANTLKRLPRPFEFDTSVHAGSELPTHLFCFERHVSTSGYLQTKVFHNYSAWELHVYARWARHLLLARRVLFAGDGAAPAPGQVRLGWPADRKRYLRFASALLDEPRPPDHEVDPRAPVALRRDSQRIATSTSASSSRRWVFLLAQRRLSLKIHGAMLHQLRGLPKANLVKLLLRGAVPEGTRRAVWLLLTGAHQRLLANPNLYADALENAFGPVAGPGRSSCPHPARHRAGHRHRHRPWRAAGAGDPGAALLSAAPAVSGGPPGGTARGLGRLPPSVRGPAAAVAGRAPRDPDLWRAV